MILFLLLLVLTGLLTLISMSFIIGGLVKKKQKVWIGGLIGFVLFSLLTVFAGYTYVKKSIAYMGSKEFQDDTKQSAENVGKTWGNTVSGTAQGLASTLDDEAIEKLANKGATIVGKGIKAVSKGLDETVGKTTVFSDESLDKQGITIGRAEEITDSTKNSFGLFLEFKQDFKGRLNLVAYDSKGLKQDNSEIEILAKAGSGKVYVFQFSYFKPGVSGYCILSYQGE